MIALVIILVIGLLAWALGRKALRGVGFSFDDTLEEFCLAFPLGLGALTLIVFLMGVLHLYTPLYAILLLGVIAIVCFSDIKLILMHMALNRCFLPKVFDLRGLDRWLVVILLALFGLMVVSSLAPPTGFDNTVYHLTVPKVFIQNEGLVSRPDVWVHKTGGFYMVYLIGMLLGYDTVAKLSIAMVTLVTMLILYSIGRRFFSRQVGLISAFLFGTTPLIGVMTGEYIEMAVIFYVAAALHAFLLYAFADRSRMKFLIPVFAGLAISAKFTAAPVVFLALPTLVLMVRRAAGAWGRFLVSAAGMALLGFIAGAFWFCWNYATTGTFFFSYSGSSWGPDVSSDAILGQLVTSPLSDILKALLDFVQRVFVMGEYWNESIGPALLFSFVTTVVMVRNRIVMGLVGLMAGMLGTYVVAMTLSYGVMSLGGSNVFHARYTAPITLTTLSLAGGYVFSWMLTRPGLLKKLAVFAMLFPVTYVMAMKTAKTAVQVPVVIGLESRDEYLKKKVETYEVCQKANQLPPSSRILFMGFRPYYLDRPYVHALPRYDTPYYRGLQTREELMKKMKADGITHVVYETMATTWSFAPLFQKPGESEEDAWKRMNREFFDPAYFELMYPPGKETSDRVVRLYRFKSEALPPQ